MAYRRRRHSAVRHHKMVGFHRNARHRASTFTSHRHARSHYHHPLRVRRHNSHLLYAA